MSQLWFLGFFVICCCVDKCAATIALKKKWLFSLDVFVCLNMLEDMVWYSLLGQLLDFMKYISVYKPRSIETDGRKSGVPVFFDKYFFFWWFLFSFFSARHTPVRSGWDRNSDWGFFHSRFFFFRHHPLGVGGRKLEEPSSGERRRKRRRRRRRLLRKKAVGGSSVSFHSLPHFQRDRKRAPGFLLLSLSLHFLNQCRGSEFNVNTIYLLPPSFRSFVCVKLRHARKRKSQPRHLQEH